MKEKIKALWKLCFDDSDEFIDMYFRMRYTNDINMAITNGEEVISALQMVSYPMTFCNERVLTSYISGACTHPDFRGNGVMQKLLSQAFARMSQDNIAFSTLIPANQKLFDYYERMGYSAVFHTAIKEFSMPELTPAKNISIRSTTDFSEEIYEYLNSRLSTRPCCIQHTKDDFKTILADLTISGGHLFAAFIEKKVAGLAIIYKENQRIQINELLTDNIDVENSLLYHIKCETNCNNAIQLMPPTDLTENSPIGMARIIDAQTVLQLYAAAHPEKEERYHLSDKQLSSNNGYYCLKNGKCTFNQENRPAAFTEISINELTDKILSPLHPYMSLMMN